MHHVLHARDSRNLHKPSALQLLQSKLHCNHNADVYMVVCLVCARRFRAQMCSFGAECNRRICFFAHAQDQLRVPSEPVVADALASRAPYLQGRVCPKSRFALYPEQVPPAIPLAGVMPQQALLAAPDLAAGQGMPQMLLVPAGDAGQVPVGLGPGAAGPMGALQQQWQHGGNMMFVPAGQAVGGAGLGYYMAAAPGAAAGGVAGGMGQPQFSTAMVLPTGSLQMASPGAAAHSSSQPLQLVTAMGPDGNIAQYPMAPGGMAFASAMYSPSGQPALSMPMQQGWSLQQVPMQQGRQQVQQQGQQRGQQQLQLLQVQKPAEALGQAAGQDGYLLMQPPFSSGQSRPVEAGGYAVISPGAPVVNAPLAPSPSAGGAAEAGPSRVDDLAQQMGGWRIT